MARKATVTLALLGMLAGGVAFFWFSSKLPGSTARSPLPTEGPKPGETNGRARANAPAAAPTVPVPDQTRLTIPFGTLVSQAKVEFSLPTPPSGDFDLTLTSDQINALVETRYGGLFQNLGLAPERLARLRALLAERQQAAIDAANSAVMVGLNPVRDLPTIGRAVEQVQAPFEAALRGELGEAVFAACREADGTIRERNATGDFARLLAGVGEPLRPEQQAQLLKILKNAPGWDPPAEVDRMIYGGVNDRARISDRAVAAAERVLSPRQLELFRQLQRHWSAEDALRWPNENRSP